MRKPRPLKGYLQDAQADAEFALGLLASEAPEDKALLAERVDDLAKALTNSAIGLRRWKERNAP